MDALGVPAPRLGALLTAARTRAGLDVDDVAARAGVGARRLRRWERGEDLPSDDDLAAVLGVLGIDAGELVPAREPVAYDADQGLVTVGHRSAAVTPAGDGDGNEAVLRTYLGLVAEVRGTRLGAGIGLRIDDIEVLAQLLDLDDADLEARLERLLGVTPTAAGTIRALISRHRVIAAAASMTIGLLAAVPLVTSGHPSAAAAETTAPIPAPPAAAMAVATPATLPTSTTSTTTSVVVAPAAPVLTLAAVPEEPAPPAAEDDEATPTTAPQPEIGTALFITRAPAPDGSGTQLGDVYVYER